MRFLELDVMRVNLLISDFGVPVGAARGSQAIASNFLDVDVKPGLSKASLDEIIQRSKCATCEAELSKERERALEWKLKVEKERSSVGECIYRRSCKVVKIQDTKRL